MKPRIETFDRVLRIFVGLGFSTYVIINHTWLGVI